MPNGVGKINFGTILRIMSMANMKIQFTAGMYRLVAQIRLHHIHIMGYHDKSHVMMMVHMPDHLKEIGLCFGVDANCWLV